MKNAMRNFVIGTIVAAGLLVVANSAVWVNRTIFNTKNFTEISTNALLSESSRQALAGEIVNTALANNPTVRTAVSEPATNLISGLLNTQQARNALTKLVSSVQILVTSENPQNIEYDLTGVKETVSRILTLAGRDEAAAKTDQIPDKIVVFDASKVPPFYQYGFILTLLAPVAALAAVALLVMPHVKKRIPTEKLLLIQGGILTGAGLLALLIGPIFRPPVLAQVSNANLRVVVENFYNAFLGAFNSQTYYLIGIGVIIMLVPLFQRLYRLIRATYFNKPKTVAKTAPKAPTAKTKSKKK